MKKTKKYQGVVVPTVTPLRADHRLDHQGVEKLFHHLHRYKAQPFILGTTGESASLPLALKKEFIQLAGRLKQPGQLLYGGISSNCLEESVELAQRCFDAGIDVVAATLPTYYALSEDQMKRYFEQLADRVAGPLIIYNIPATTHMSIPLSVIGELSRHDNIVGTKDSERSEVRMAESLALWSGRQDFSYFLGWAAASAQALLLGADGLIPSTGNLYPRLYREMVLAARAGNRESAHQLQQLSDRLGHLYQAGRTLGESLWALKVLLQEAGICQAHVMPPLQPLPPAEAAGLRRSLHDLISEEILALDQPLNHV
jgi:dihydrodipicolinate synthase/N-acetylneuraminate lyase